MALQADPALAWLDPLPQVLCLSIFMQAAPAASCELQCLAPAYAMAYIALTNVQSPYSQGLESGGSLVL